MKEIYIKLANCKKFIKESSVKKEGRNAYSDYDYFTPQQIEKLVFDACTKESLITHFNMIKNEFGISGNLNVICLDTGNSIQFTMVTDIPQIKATNISQQLGGCMTYTERYLKMTAFGIVENSLDFDANNDTQKEEPKTEPIGIILQNAILEMQKCKTLDEVKSIWSKYKAIQNEKTFIDKKEELKKQLTKN